jgi:Yip1 domain
LSTSQTSAADRRRSSFANIVDIVIDPNAAFARLREVPAWGWAFVVGTLLGIAGFLLMEPASLHAFEKSMPATYAAMPQVAQLPADKQPAVIAQYMSFGRTLTQLTWVAVPLIFLVSSLISAVVMLIANAIGHGDGSFKKFFALSMLISMIGGLALLLTGVIAIVRGADSFETTGAVQRALPNLAMLAPNAPHKLETFLGTITIAALWSTALTALGMIGVARISRPVAWTAAILMLFVIAAFTAAFAP